MGLTPPPPELDLIAAKLECSQLYQQIMRGIPIRDDDALQALIVSHNQIVRLIKEVERLRKED